MTGRLLSVDESASRLAVRTRAVGMLARLAHDLELVARHLRATASLDGEVWTAELDVRVDDLEIAGVVKGERVDAGVLSTSDCGEIIRRMRADAFHGASAVAVRAQGSSLDRAEIVVAVGDHEQRSIVRLRTRSDGDAILVAGTAPLSLKAIGAREIKAPLGAFSVKDEVQILFDLRLC